MNNAPRRDVFESGRRRWVLGNVDWWLIPRIFAPWPCFVKFLPVQLLRRQFNFKDEFRRLLEGWGQAGDSAASMLGSEVGTVRKFRELLPPTSRGKE